MPAFAEIWTHIIVTMRSDFLPELFARKALYDIAKQGIDLYAMEVDDLRRAILHPLEQQYPLGDKRFEDALLDKLAGEAAEAAIEAARAAGRALPLEQATAEAIRIAPEAQPAAGATTPAAQPAGAVPDQPGTLTPRERQVLALIAQGANNRAIADTLVIAERTAAIHVRTILGTLGLTSRTQAAAYALAQGLAAPPSA